jgi:hypothetical protein
MSLTYLREVKEILQLKQQTNKGKLRNSRQYEKGKKEGGKGDRKKFRKRIKHRILNRAGKKGEINTRFYYPEEQDKRKTLVSRKTIPKQKKERKQKSKEKRFSNGILPTTPKFINNKFILNPHNFRFIQSIPTHSFPVLIKLRMSPSQ